MITKGQKINDRYEIIKSIGEGGMANVYLAQDTILDRKVAVKVLRGDLADDEKFVRRFQREAINASSLSHPNIVEMYDVGEDKGKYFIVMEYVEGKTLKSLIKRRGALTLPEVIDIMLQITSAIAHAHESLIIHRDIKPQNVMILEDGRVKITDFGIAMALNSNELTQTNSVMGSVHYLPPEQANGNGATVKSDIYSSGILMYELVTGKVPFKGDNAVEIAIKHMKDKIPSVCTQNEEIPQSIENIILKASAKNPKNRYNSIVEMHDDLKTALNPDRANEPRVRYKYPEEDFETDTEEIPNREMKNKNKKEDQKVNKSLKILGIVAGILVFLVLFVALIVPKILGSSVVVVPDVSDMSVSQAKSILKDKKLKVNSKYTKKYSSKIDKGKVIFTDPKKNRKVKKDTKITLIVSKGVKKITIKDYRGKYYETVKQELEDANITVKTKTKEVSSSSAKEDTIIDQDIEAGTKLGKGDTITLTIPKFYTAYPDFVNDNYSLSDIQSWCSKNNVSLETVYQETTSASGSILYQSRTAGSKVVSGESLKITVTKQTTTTTDDTNTGTN